jgi:unsaturated rhamnogalacturonyl hydrolase
MVLVAVLCGTACGQSNGDAAALKATETMASSVMKAWPNGVVATTGKPGQWGYEEGVLLDGLAAEWHQTANGDEFRYIKTAVDKYVTRDGTIQMDASGKPFGAEEHQLDWIELGRAVMLVYRVTQQPKYYNAAKFLHEQLEAQPRGASGGYWHKQIYPNQMWLDGAYMAEPFRAAYAATFHEDKDWDDIAKQFQLMYDHMRDPATGLLKHGWDESKQIPWADKTTGLSPEVWARALGWYCMALVDVLDWFPEDHPQRVRLVQILQTVMDYVIQYQDLKTGLWWQVMDKGPQVTGTIGPKGVMVYKQDRPARAGNFPEASASAMFVYATAKSVRMGYLPQHYDADAKKGWAGIQETFVTKNPDGTVTLTGTVKAAGLGGKPYRSGTYEYYVGEKTGDNDAKGVGAYLLAGSEMEQADTAGLGHGPMSVRLGAAKKGKGNVAVAGPGGGEMTATQTMGSRVTVLLDAWFNSQTRKNAAGQTELYHYKWDDDSNSGFSFFGRAFQSYGARLKELKTAPTFGAQTLDGAQIYILVSPDIPAKNPETHYMDKASGDAIEAWVKAGGVLLLMENDKTNSEFEHFNTLSERFGIHFNAVLRNAVEGTNYEMGRMDIPATTGVFREEHEAFMKEISTINVSGAAKAIFTDQGDVIIALSRAGKGVVFAVTDPWVYNEYVDRRNKLPPEFDGYAAAKDLARWAVEQANAVRR